MNKELYDWQEECLERWFEHNGRGIVQAVTGSGKTLLALSAMDRLNQKLNGSLRVKIVVPTGALMRQWNQALREYLAAAPSNDSAAANGPGLNAPYSALLPDSRSIRSDIGLRGAGSKSTPDHKYMIYVINSARYELARQILTELRQGADILLIADECHHYESAQNQLIFEFLPYISEYESHFFSLGLSATLPSGASQRCLTSVLGRKIYHYGMKEAAAGNTISPYDVYHISLSFRADERDEYEEFTDQMTLLYGKLLKAYPALHTLTQKERFEELQSIAGNKKNALSKTAATYMNLTFKRRRLVCLASARVSCVCDLVRQLDIHEKILIFGERISQAEELYRLLQEVFPEKTGRLHSKMGSQANKNVLERFRTGSIRILIACKAIDEGFDVPDSTVGIILSGTSTKRQRIQRLGRIIRRKETDAGAALYYLHITETVEEACYLPDAGEHRLFELSYDAETQSFCNPAYDDRADRLLSEMEQNGADASTLQEAKRCLLLGCVRSDWKLPLEILDRHIQAARYTGEKNYWVCMKKLYSLRVTQ